MLPVEADVRETQQLAIDHLVLESVRRIAVIGGRSESQIRYHGLDLLTSGRKLHVHALSLPSLP